MTADPHQPSRPRRSAAWFGDVAGGITSAVVALPLALAFAIASGVDPKAGLYTAIVAGIVASLFGGAPLQITGPTGAMAVVLVGIVSQYGLEGVWIAGLMAGAMQLGLGLARMGRLVSFVPMPVITGFTAGIGVIIFVGQLGNALGLKAGAAEGGLFAQLGGLLHRLPQASLPAIALTAGVLVIMALWPRLNKTIPASLVALIAMTGAATAFGLDVPRIGEIPQGLPMPALPPFAPERLGELVRPALALAALGAIESLLSASVADRLSGAPPMTRTASWSGRAWPTWPCPSSAAFRPPGRSRARPSTSAPAPRPAGRAWSTASPSRWCSSRSARWRRRFRSPCSRASCSPSAAA